mgnify:CR=1 FL=1
MYRTLFVLGVAAFVGPSAFAALGPAAPAPRQIDELARLADLSDAYVSKLERGMHHPTVGALRAIGLSFGIELATGLLVAGTWLTGVLLSR